MPELPRYLDCTAVAARLNVAVGTVHDYRSMGRLPEPDTMLGKSPGWLPETIENYIAALARRGRSRARANVHGIEQLVETNRKHIGDGVWRIMRGDTGRVLGLVARVDRRAWRASASMRAFLGDGPASSEPLGDFVPRALYAPLLASEGHHYLPGTYRSRERALSALQTYLDEQRAPAMGYGSHPAVRREKAS